MPTSEDVNTAAENFIADTETADEKINGSAGTVTDRHGTTTKNLEQIFSEVGYNPPETFASGISATSGRDTVYYNGDLYSANPSEVPFTTTASFDASQWLLVVPAYQRWPNPFFMLWIGQSNAKGSDGGSGLGWPTTAGLVLVWVPGTGWVDSITLQGSDPFNTNGSNCAGVHQAHEIAVKLGVTVYMVLAVEGGTELSEWTGGGYAGGVAITTDRTISATNRVQYKKITDAVASATSPEITQFDSVGFIQGESDADTPEPIWMSEVEYLRGEIYAEGTNPDLTRVMPFIVSGLYTGPEATQQSLRSSAAEALVRRNPDKYGFIATHDLTGVTGGAIVNHFDTGSLTTIGERGARATIGVFNGSYVLTDKRLEDMMIPAMDDILNTSFIGERLGHRRYVRRYMVDGDTETFVIRDGDHGRGEMYSLEGATTLDLDGSANSLLNDDGRGCFFFQSLATDSVTLNGNGRSITLEGYDGALETSITITGRGFGSIEYRNNRYMVRWFPTLEHNDTVIQNAVSTEKQMYSPAQLRTAANAAIAANVSVTEQSSDLGANIYAGTTALNHTGTLTANRSVVLDDADRYSGEQVTVTNAGAGAFSLSIRNHDNSVILNLPNGSWATMIFDGTDWYQAAAGTLI